MRSGPLWLALCAALSPLLLDLGLHWWTHPWASASVIFVALAARQLSVGGVGVRWRGAIGLLAIALVWELVAVGGGMTRLARPALPMAVLGLAGILGRPSPRSAALALWAVPVPSFAMSWLAPGLGAAGSSLPLALEPQDSGLPLLWFCVGWAVYRGVRLGVPLRDEIPHIGRWVLAALAMQLVAIGGAEGIALLGAPEAARLLLDLAPGWVFGLLALLVIERQARSAT